MNNQEGVSLARTALECIARIDRHFKDFPNDVSDGAAARLQTRALLERNLAAGVYLGDYQEALKEQSFPLSVRRDAAFYIPPPYLFFPEADTYGRRAVDVLARALCWQGYEAWGCSTLCGLSHET